jgi:hypothetical protein
VKRGFDDVGCNPAFGAAIRVEFRTEEQVIAHLVSKSRRVIWSSSTFVFSFSSNNVAEEGHI